MPPPHHVRPLEAAERGRPDEAPSVRETTPDKGPALLSERRRDSDSNGVKPAEDLVPDLLDAAHPNRKGVNRSSI